MLREIIVYNFQSQTIHEQLLFSPVFELEMACFFAYIPLMQNPPKPLESGSEPSLQWDGFDLCGRSNRFVCMEKLYCRFACITASARLGMVGPCSLCSKPVSERLNKAW